MNYGNYYGSQQGYYGGYYPTQIGNYYGNNQQYQQTQQATPASQQSQQMQQIQPNGQSLLYVASIEEVKAHPVDWSGGISYFVDKVNSCIYTKQLGDNGIPTILTYKLDISNDNKVEYVTREEFDTVKASLDTLLTQLGEVNNNE